MGLKLRKLISSPAILLAGPVGIGLYAGAKLGAKKKGGGGGPSEMEIARERYSGLQQEFGQIPEEQRVGLEEQSKRAGTFAETPAFKSGFESELQARVRGVRLSNIQRRRAIARQLGLPEPSLDLA